MLKFFDPNPECFAKYDDTFCSHIFNSACLRRKTYSYRRGSKLQYRKIVCIKKIFENGCWEDVYPSSYLSRSAPGRKLQELSKESGIFQSLGTNSIVLVY